MQSEGAMNGNYVRRPVNRSLTGTPRREPGASVRFLPAARWYPTHPAFGDTPHAAERLWLGDAPARRVGTRPASATIVAFGWPRRWRLDAHPCASEIGPAPVSSDVDLMNA